MTLLHLKYQHQRSLLDRLTDDAPEHVSESLYAQVESDQALCESVRQSLTELFNTTHLGAHQDLTRYPEVRRSTVNYGITDLAGRTRSGIDPDMLARSLREAIEHYEPRLIHSSLRVRVNSGHDDHDALEFVIEADVIAAPFPIALALRGHVDLENGRILLEETATKGKA